MDQQNQELNNKVYVFLPWISALALFMQTLDGTILNTALPSIAKDMNRSPLSMQSVIIAYVLVLALLIPLSGWLSDQYGSKKVFMWAVVIFTGGSLLCALSSNLESLVISRVIQAIGGSMLVPVSRLAILYTYSKSKLLAVINFVTIPGLVGPIIGPTLGGWLVDVASWHWNFLINIPIGIVGLIFAYKYMPDYVNKGKKFDYIGMVLFGGSLIFLTLAIELESDNVINEWYIRGLFLSGILLMVFYYFYFKRSKNPIINLNLLKIRTLGIGVFGNLLTRLGIGGMPLLLPLLFQIGFGYSAMASGMLLIPSAIATLLAKSWVIPIVTRIGYKRTLIINTFLIALIISLFAIPNKETSLLFLIPLLLLFGFVNSIQMTSMNTLAISDLNKKRASNGNSLLLVVQQLSMSLGISISAYLLNKYNAIPSIKLGDPVLVFRYTFITMAVITFFAAFIFFALKSTDGKNLTEK